MSATLKLTHKAIGAEVRRGSYDVVVDRERVGSVEMNATVELPVDPGSHTLQVRNGRMSSGVPVYRKTVLADLPGVLHRSRSGTEALSRLRRRRPSWSLIKHEPFIWACSSTEHRDRVATDRGSPTPWGNGPDGRLV